MKDVKEKPKFEKDIKTKPQSTSSKILQKTVKLPLKAGAKAAKAGTRTGLNALSQLAVKNLTDAKNAKNIKCESQAVNQAANDLERYSVDGARRSVRGADKTARFTGRNVKKGVKLVRDKIKQRQEIKLKSKNEALKNGQSKSANLKNTENSDVSGFQQKSQTAKKAGQYNKIKQRQEIKEKSKNEILNNERLKSENLKNTDTSNTSGTSHAPNPQSNRPTSRASYSDGNITPKSKENMLKNSRRVKERSVMQNSVKQRDGAVNRATADKTKNVKNAAKKKVSLKQSTAANRAKSAKTAKVTGGKLKLAAKKLAVKAQQMAKARAVRKAQIAMAKKTAVTTKVVATKAVVATKVVAVKTAIVAKPIAIKAAIIAKKLAFLLAKVTAAAAKGVVALIAAGGWVVIVIILIAALAAMILSPLGIFFSNDNSMPDTAPLSAVVGMLNAEFSNDLRGLQETNHDILEIHGSMADWAEVVAVFAVKTAGREDSYALDVVTFDNERIEILRTVFRDMNGLRSRTESRASGEYTFTVLHIYIESRNYAQMAAQYNFSAEQNNVLIEILTQRAVLAGLIGSLQGVTADTAAILASLPYDLSPERRAVVKYSLSLVGKVNYFWGGKSNIIGWDSRWGTLQRVTSAGSSTTGHLRVFGLDCSGYVTWVFINASRNLGAVSIIGEGTYAQDSRSTRIAWANAQPGDLAFFNDLSHIGIVVGHDTDGHLLVAHVSSSFNNVTVCRAADFGFGFISRPSFAMFQ